MALPETEFALILLVGVTVLATVGQLHLTYEGDTWELHRATIAIYGLYLANIGVAFAFFVGYWQLSPAPSWWSGILIGLGLPAVTQSRVSIGRPLATFGAPLKPESFGLPARGFWVDLNRVYMQYARIFQSEVDARRAELYEALMPDVFQRHPTIRQMANLARKSVRSRGLSDTERDEHLKYIESLEFPNGLRTGRDKRQGQRKAAKKHRRTRSTKQERYELLTQEVGRLMGLGYVRRALVSGLWPDEVHRRWRRMLLADRVFSGLRSSASGDAPTDGLG